MPQQLDLKAKGLYTNPNPIGSVPPGALEVAKNVNIDQDNVITNRRGFKTFGNAIGISDSQTINGLYAFKDRLITHFHTTLAYDSDGSGDWANYSSTYAPPDGEQKIRSVGASGNFYFTTDAGIGKLAAIDGSPGAAGIPKALGGKIELVGTTGFFTTANQVGYRVVWGFEDANGNLLLGSPSERLVIANTTGSSEQVKLTLSIPATVTTSFFYQIYRTGLSGGAAIIPNDEMQLVAEKYPTSSEISAKSLIYTDNVSDSLRGATLYTSPSQQGIAQANEQPPMATDITSYKGHVLYFNTTSKQRLIFTLIAVNNGSLGYYAGVSVTGVASNVITVSSASNIAVGQLVTAASGLVLSAGTKVSSIDGTDITLSSTPTGSSTGTVNFHDRVTISGTAYYAYSSFNVSNNYFEVPTSGTISEQIEGAAKSLIRVINESSSNTSVYAYYLSNVDDLPGKIIIEERSIGGSVFYGTTSKGSSISPEWVEAGTSVASSNERAKNRVYISKPQQPESVPTLNYIDLGSADKEILRGLALRDSCFVFKEDGIFRITGESVSSFQATLFDNTAVLKVKESAVELNNQIFCFSDQGVVAVSDAGVQVLSRPIEEDLKKLQSANYPNFATASFGIGYESERKYIFYTVSQTDDTKGTQAFIYNVFTDSWTTWTGTRTCGIVNPVDDKLYLASGDITSKYVYQERKAFDIFDNADEEFAVTINSITSSTVVVVASATGLVLGQTLAQSSSKKGVITKIVGTTITVDRAVSFATGAATSYNPIATQVKYAPSHGGNPGILKHFSELIMFFREADFKTLTLKVNSNFSLTEVSTSLAPVGGGDWGGYPWGSQPWGDSPVNLQPIRTYIPLGSQRANWISLKIQHEEALTKFALAGFSLWLNGMSARFK
jgi:hypothetical protein